MRDILIIYGTDGCHLCDKATDFLKQKQIEFHYIDIAHNEKLVSEYGWFIPVIQYNETIWKSPLPWDEILKSIN